MVYSWWKQVGLVVLALAFSVSLPGVWAEAADPRTGLTEAESRAVTAATDFAAAEQQLDAARDRFEATRRRAAPVAAGARAARAEAHTLRAQLVVRQQRAKVEIADLEANHRQEVDEHDEEVAFGIGIGLALLVGAGIALAWNPFRTSSTVRKLTGLDLGRALALCLGGGFLLLVLGAALSGGTGFTGAAGAFLFGLGVVLPTAFLLARRSAEIERGRTEPALKRGRVPSWVPRSVGILLLLFAVAGLGSAILSDEPTADDPSAQLREQAEALTEGSGADRLAEAESEAENATGQAITPLAQQSAAGEALRRASQVRRAAADRLADAEADQRRFVRSVQALEAREEREAIRTAKKEEREAEERADEESETVPAAGCDPNYSGCVPAYPPDADCAEVGETVSVIGADPHGLDADGDLIACE